MVSHRRQGQRGAPEGALDPGKLLWAPLTAAFSPGPGSAARTLGTGDTGWRGTPSASRAPPAGVTDHHSGRNCHGTQPVCTALRFQLLKRVRDVPAVTESTEPQSPALSTAWTGQGPAPGFRRSWVGQLHAKTSAFSRVYLPESLPLPQ